MKISKSLLHKTLSFLTGLLDKKAEGVYSLIQIRNKSKLCTITGIGTHCSSEIVISSETEDEVSFTIKGNIGDDIINALDSEVISIEISDELILRGNGVFSRIPFETNFPRPIEPPAKEYRVIEHFDLKTFCQKLKIISKVVYEGPLEGTSSNVYIDSGEIRGTDDSRFIWSKFRFPHDLMIPKNVVSVIIGFAELVPFVDVFVSKQDNDATIRFSNNSGSLILLAGRAPQLPTSNELTANYSLPNCFAYSREAFILAMKRALITSNPKNPEFRMRNEKGKLILISEFDNHLTVQEICDCNFEIDLLLEPKGLADLLSLIPGETLNFNTGDSLSPLRIKVDDYSLLIMPLSP